VINGAFRNIDSRPGATQNGSGESHRVPEVVRHLTLALSGYVRRLHQDGLSAPRDVEELTYFLVCLARIRHDPPLSASDSARGKDARMPDRLLVTKGEAAERLGVSVRTVERLVATGRLPQVHVERLARFRVSDLEAFVDSLTEVHGPDGKSDNHVRP
jgi:excisionase family DNA binding protein